MNHFHNAKIIATMGPAIDKETVLSKVIQNIDVFRINLSHGDEEVKKRYVDIINKLDNSKSILLDTKGPEIRTKNKFEIEYTVGSTVFLKYAEFFKEEENTIFIDYVNLENIPLGTHISFDMDQVVIEITNIIKNGNGFEAKVIYGGILLINRLVDFENYIPKLPFLGEKDKKHIEWGLEHKVSLVAVSYIRYPDNVLDIRRFFESINGKHLKLIAKIETQECIDNIEAIIELVDGIIINKKKLGLLVGEDNVEKTRNMLINISNRRGKPISVHSDFDIRAENHEEVIQTIREEIALGVDSFVLTKETSIFEDPSFFVEKLYEIINSGTIEMKALYNREDIHFHEDNIIQDYMLYNVYKTSKELDIKAIICPTQSGYTPARLSALKPNVPIIAFTKDDDAYRYLNLLW